MNKRAPAILLNLRRSRATTSPAVSVRSDKGLSWMDTEPLLVEPAPPPLPVPVLPVTTSTAGSACVMSTSSASLTLMDWKEMLWSA